MKKYWILMADVKDSSHQLGNKLAKTLNQIVKLVNAKNGGVLSPLTVTLGDEFQGVMANKLAGIEAIIQIEEYLIKVPSTVQLRYVLWYGKIDTPINPEVAHGMLGEGLTKARRMLGEIKKEEQRFMIGPLKENENLNRLFLLYQFFKDGWKQEDYVIVKNFIEMDDYRLVAKKLKKNESLMWKRKKSLHIDMYNTIKAILRTQK